MMMSISRLHLPPARLTGPDYPLGCKTGGRTAAQGYPDPWSRDPAEGILVGVSVCTMWLLVRLPLHNEQSQQNLTVASNLPCSGRACGGVQDGRRPRGDLREREVRGRRIHRGLHPVQGRGRPGRRPLPAFNIAPGHRGGVHRGCVCWRM